MSIVPVLIYHRIDDRGGVPPSAFERQMRYLRRKRFHTATLDELLDHLEGRLALPARSVALTFDDATADHWSLAFPVLVRHGLKATFFVPTALPAEGDVRPCLDDVRSGRAGAEELPRLGPMRWSEIAAAAASGLIAIESHGHRHARHVSGPRIVRFTGPSDGVPRSEWGSPVYQSSSELAAPRFDPPSGEVAAIHDEIDRRGRLAFFAAPAWEEDLRVFVDRFREGQPLRWSGESREGHLERVEDELRRSLDTMRERIDRRPRFLAWPFGEAGIDEHAIALRCGFEATFLSSGKTLRREPRLLPRHHFGEDYDGPARATVHYWRFVRTLESAWGIGMRRHLSVALSPLIRSTGSRGRRRPEGIPWRG